MWTCVFVVFVCLFVLFVLFVFVVVVCLFCCCFAVVVVVVLFFVFFSSFFSAKLQNIQTPLQTRHLFSRALLAHLSPEHLSPAFILSLAK